jgi:predicted nucleotidyltransferase
VLSIKPDRLVHAVTVAVSRQIDQIAREFSVPYFLAGAMARDIVLTHVYGIDIGRATRDVDFGKDVRRIASPATLEQARAFLEDAQKMDRLVTHMSVVFRAEDDSIAAAARLLEQFKLGLVEQ